MLCVDGDLDNYTHISEIIKINKNKKSLSSFFGENCNDAVGSGKTSKYSNVSFVVSSNNKSLDVDLEITSLKNSNKNLEGYILNFRNISERLKLEQELNHERAMSAHSAKLASLGEMAGGIAHEINTPLAVIMLSNEEIGAELTSDKPDYNYVLSLVATIKDTTEKVSKIVKALRALSHVGGDNTQESILIDSIIDNVLTLSNEKIRINQVSLTYENQIGSDSVIYCDQVQMSQVLLNLISNSIDAIETLDDRWIKVQVSECNDFIQISIIDSGRGIHDSSLDKIFEPFYTTKSVGKGTGLGMSISKAIMTKHGGKIAYDKRSSNTKFDLFLPKININQKVS